jgi:hypothetical protein
MNCTHASPPATDYAVNHPIVMGEMPADAQRFPLGPAVQNHGDEAIFAQGAQISAMMYPIYFNEWF